MKRILILSLYFTAVCATSCTENDGNDDQFVFVPTKGVTSLSETFERFALNDKVDALGGWSELHVAGFASWKIAGAADNKYVGISAETEANNACETWLLTPALDLANAPNKTLSFSTQGAYWRENSALEVYLLTKHSTDAAVPLAAGDPDYVRIADKDDDPNAWIPSGEIDLSRHAGLGIVYVAFRYTAAGGADNSTTFRVDNVTLGSAAGDTVGVAALSEDFESFAEGTGNAYMSAQPDSKGWKGLSVQGALEPDVRIYNNNKYVQMSAHRNAITTSEVQEFWLISPGLDVDAATEKAFSFDVSAGYYNASTVFEVYVLDDPAAAGKTKVTAWSEPVNIPSGAYSAFASSGNIDLSAYSGVKHIGFYYRGNSGSGNSTTYQIDNFVFGGSASLTPVLRFTSAATATAFVGSELKHTFALEEKNLTDEATSLSCANLPGWLTLTDKTLTGTPSDADTGRYELSVSAANGGETATQIFTVTVRKAPSTGSNLVVNGSFEDFTGDVPTGWSLGSGVNNNPVEKITDGAKEGSIAVKLAANDQGRCDVKQSVLGIVPGATYTVSFWYKSNTKSATSSGVRLWANFVDATNTAITPDANSKKLLQPDNTLDAASDWTLYSANVVAPAGAAGFNFEIRATKNQNGIVDNCSMVNE
ncbi:MAG: choice-of-anchor J domain-containing protein [Prevotellaceae bacterium]|jgi:hypothetical protein|nr:choice-of-anchor J domain-containing protein [Prevotellaceae bacterium]